MLWLPFQSNMLSCAMRGYSGLTSGLFFSHLEQAAALIVPGLSPVLCPLYMLVIEGSRYCWVSCLCCLSGFPHVSGSVVVLGRPIATVLCYYLSLEFLVRGDCIVYPYG